MTSSPPQIVPECVLLRHGESTDTAAGLVSGQRDTPLTPRGYLQARKAADHLPRLGIKAIVSSDLQRASDTAKTIAHALALPPIRLDPRLRERRWGAKEGKPHGFQQSASAEPPEPEPEFTSRVSAALAEIAPGSLVVTHAGPIGCILRKLCLPGGAIAPAQFYVLTTAPANRAPARPLRVIGSVINLQAVAQQALEIYSKTGRGDLEFALWDGAVRRLASA